MGVFVLALDAGVSRAATPPEDRASSPLDPTTVAQLEQSSGDLRRFGPATRGVVEDVRQIVERRARSTSETRAALRDGAVVAAGVAALATIAFAFTLIRAGRSRAGRVAPFGYRLLAGALLFLGVTSLGGTAVVVRAIETTLGLRASTAADLAGLDALDAEAEAAFPLGAAAVTRALETTARGDASTPASLLDATARRSPSSEAHADGLRAASGLVDVSVMVADYAPLAIAVLLAFGLLATSRPSWRAFVEIPALAAPEPHVAAAVRSTLFDRVVRELCGIVALAFAAVTGGTLVALSAGAVASVAARATVSLTLATAARLDRADAPSNGVLVAGLVASAAFAAMAAAFAVVFLATSILRMHGLLLRRLHHGASLGSHGRFWRAVVWGSLVALAMPLGHALAVTALAEGPLVSTFGNDGAGLTRRLVLTGAVFVVGYLVVLWAVRGMRALAVVATTTGVEVSPTTARSASLTPPIDPMAAPLPPSVVPVARRHAGGPAMVSTLPSASEPPPRRSVDLGPLSSTTPSATSPDELDGNKKPRRA